MRWVTGEDVATTEQAAAEFIAAQLGCAVRERGRATFAVSGGRTPWAMFGRLAALEKDLKAHFDSEGIAFKRYAGALLREPEDIRTKSGDVYKVYTPFWRALSAEFHVAAPKPAPKSITPPKEAPKSIALDGLGLLPKKPDWAGGLREAWMPGEKGAHARLDAFLKSALKGYAEDRNRPDVEGTSRLSPHLHFGEISPAMCWFKAGMSIPLVLRIAP